MPTRVALAPSAATDLESSYLVGGWRNSAHAASFRLPTQLSCDLVAALVPESETFGDPDPRGVVRRMGLQLSPGVVQLRTTVRGEGPDDAWALDWWDQAGTGDQARKDGRRRITHASLANAGAALGSKSEITEWSRKSRLNMARVLASLDWAGHIDSAPAGWRPQMLTLTLPGDWLTIAPDGATFKRLFRAWLARWERKWGQAWAGTWKLEFQGRGAPHLHLYGNAPLGRDFRDWLSLSWYEVCGSGDERHLRAGTGADWREGIRATDPRSVALYFLGKSVGHNLGLGKEYQHVVPEEWREAGKGPGRFWGHRGMTRVSARVEIGRDTYLRLRRLVARWGHANGRRINSASWSRWQGYTLLVPDAPAWLSQALRAINGTDPPPGRLAGPLGMLP